MLLWEIHPVFSKRLKTLYQFIDVFCVSNLIHAVVILSFTDVYFLDLYIPIKRSPSVLYNYYFCFD